MGIAHTQHGLTWINRMNSSMVLNKMRQLEDEFIKVVETPGEQADATLRRIRHTLEDLCHQPDYDSLSSDEAKYVKRIIQRLLITCSGIDRFASLSSKLLTDSRRRLQESLGECGMGQLFQAFTSPPLDREDTSVARATVVKNELIQPYRSWFVDNFAWPYPESSERLRLLAQVPSHDRAQLSNWFVNSRRRSGWSRLAKKYTDGDRNAFAAFLRKIDSGNATEEEVEDVEKCKAHFMDKGNMLVRDGIEEVLTAASKGALTDGCVPPSTMALTRLFPIPIKIEDPGNPVLSKKRGRIEDVEDPPSSPCSKRSTVRPVRLGLMRRERAPGHS